MPSCYQASFLLKILHFLHVKDEMTTYFLKRWWRVTPFIQNLESDLHLYHLLVPYGILPQGIPVFVVDSNTIGKGLRYFDTSFMRAFMIAPIHRHNDSATTANWVRDPPSKSGFRFDPFAVA